MTSDPMKTSGETECIEEGGPALVVLCRESNWPAKLPELETIIKAVLHELTSALPPDTLSEGEICLVLSNDEEVRALNHTYRGKDKPTNVLSFPASEDTGGDVPEGAPEGRPGDMQAEPDPTLGDVVMALETVAREAQDQQKTLADHFSHLLVHGILHLLGYDHQNDGEAGQMEALELRILGAMGITNPYEGAAQQPEET